MCYLSGSELPPSSMAEIPCPAARSGKITTGTGVFFGQFLDLTSKSIMVLDSAPTLSCHSCVPLLQKDQGCLGRTKVVETKDINLRRITRFNKLSAMKMVGLSEPRFLSDRKSVV